MKVIDYINQKVDTLQKAIDGLNIATNRCINAYDNKKYDAKAYADSTKNSNILSVDVKNAVRVDYKNNYQDKDIKDRNGNIIKSRPEMLDNSIGLLDSFKRDESPFSTCTVRGMVSGKANEIVDKSPTTAFNVSSYFDNKLSKYVFDDIENTTSSSCGLFVEVCIDFPTLRKINFLDISINSKYFNTIDYIKISKTDNDYHREDLGIKPFNIDKNKSIDLNPFLAKKIYIGFIQPHYVLKQDKLKTKFHYSINISNISCMYKTYTDVSAVDSTFITSTTSKNLSLSTNVDGDSFDLSQEHSISFDNVHFYNILPLNQDVVVEKLFYINDFIRFRFSAEKLIAIYKDGKPIKEFKEKVVDGKVIGITGINIHAGSSYMAEYIPCSSAYFISGTDIPFTLENETFSGDDSTTYTLSKPPTFSDGVSIEILDNIKSRIFKDDMVINTTGEDYWGKSKFSYKIKGNKLIFSKPLDDRYVINVKYRVSGNGFILRTVLRRNTKKTAELTTRVSDIMVLNGEG